MNLVSIRHNFEAGHRLPHLPGKCQSLHGHSWWAEVWVEGPLVEGIVVDFGSLKAALRGWIDNHLDHGLILGRTDELVPILREHGKVYVVREWPTVESIAELLAQVTARLLDHEGLAGEVVRVRVTETHVNAAEWIAG